MDQEIRFCRSADGTSIAYALAGEGPALVLAGPWTNVSHLENDWEPDSPVKPVLGRLAAKHRFIRFDPRGTGLSARDVDDYSVESMTADLEAVVGAAGLRRFSLLGVHLGGAIALEYAARHASRLEGLALYATTPDGSAIASEELRDSHRKLIRAHWGVASRAWAEWFAPSQVEDASFVQRLGRSIRQACDVEAAVSIFDIQHSADLRHRLAEIAVPALVVTRTGDRIMPVRLPRQLAASLPNARFVPLAGNDDIPVSDADADELVSLIEQFLETARSDRDQRRSADATQLTRRELDVLRLLGSGRTNREVADDLGLSVYTVNRHVSSVLARLGVANRVEAARWAVEHDLLEDG